MEKEEYIKKEQSSKNAEIEQKNKILIAEYRSGNENALVALFENNRRLFEKIVKECGIDTSRKIIKEHKTDKEEYVNVKADELIYSVCYSALWEVLKSFDEERGSFSNWLTNVAHNAVLKELNQNQNQEGKAHTSDHYARMIRDINQAESDFYMEHGRKPSVQELAKMTKYSASQVTTAMLQAKSVLVSIEAMEEQYEMEEYNPITNSMNGYGKGLDAEHEEQLVFEAEYEENQRFLEMVNLNFTKAELRVAAEAVDNHGKPRKENEIADILKCSPAYVHQMQTRYKRRKEYMDRKKWTK